KIRFMPNATDFVYPDDADKRKAIVRNKYGVLGDDKLFLFVGRLVTQKNILFIVEVLRRLKERGLVFRMLYVGDGPDKKKLENKIIEEGVEKECVLVGKISDKDLIKDYYLAADMVLFPSKYDVSSLIQIEAAAMKTPCAFMEGSVTSCTITGGVDGLILPDDADGFAEGVYDLVTDGEKLENMSEMAYKNVYVTWERVSSLALERYKRLAEKSRDVKQAEDE
ncbi:MAG: glycosyltransferase family 4 protein, partial [Clostridia bacterium]|nr:glycosyltransferase family 4 protein [Clostridia bacterium]